MAGSALDLITYCNILLITNMLYEFINFSKGRVGAPRPDASACASHALQRMKEAGGTIGTTWKSLIEPTDKQISGLLGNH